MSLPNFTDKYLQVFDPETKALELRHRSKREGSSTLLQSMELVGLMLKKFQTTYRVNDYDPKILFMPFLFIEPEEGDAILNESTGETYTVDQKIINPANGRWEGLIQLNSINAPDYSDQESLVFLEEKNYVNFDHSYRTSPPNDLSKNENEGEINAPPMRPIISWTLARKEPGSTTGEPFGPRKELKMRFRENVKDPQVEGYSVGIFGQNFDNIVQFDAWYVSSRSAERLIGWFEQFMQLNAWVFQKYGVSQVFFWKRPEDTTETKWRQPIWHRASQFYFRTEQLEAVYQRDLLRFDIELGMANSMPKPEQGKRYIAGRLVTGNITPSGYRSLFWGSGGEYLYGEIDILQ